MIARRILGILWARRLLVLVATGSSLLGGAMLATTAAPRYQATAKVLLDYIKPDPVTGEYVGSKMAQAYIVTQMQMVRDYQVAIPAAEALGMLDNLELQSTFAATPQSQTMEYQQWVGQMVLGTTGVRLIPDSNIIEISSTTSSQEVALEYVEAVRTAYIEANIQSKRRGAAAGAEALSEQAALQVTAVSKLETAKRALENATGAMPQYDAERLAEMVVAVRPLYVDNKPKGSSQGRLTAIEAQITEATRTLGPNHPQIIALRATRDLVKRQVETEQDSQGTANQTVAAYERARQDALDAQVSKVLSNRQIALELRLLNEEIERRRGILQELNTKIAGLRQLTALEQVSLTPVGPPVVKETAVFPNYPLILGGAAVLGLGIGSMLALLVELLGRRARLAADLVSSVGAPLLGVVPAAKPPRRRGGTRRLWPSRRAPEIKAAA